MYQRTTATRKIAALSKRIRIVQGGTSASKTVSILLYLIACAQSDKTPTTTSVVSQYLPHLKRGAIKDFLSIMEEHQYFDQNRWNKSELTYTFETGSTIEFFSADQPGKVRGPRRDRLFLNEANNVPFETFDQLSVRTKEFIFIDYNPTNEFWVQTELIGRREDLDFLILTYKDNEALAPQLVADIESRQHRKGWWLVYGLGQLGEVEGRIYTGWQKIDDVPHEARLERYGVDFGYTNDPTAIVAVYYYNGGYILDEIAFTKGLSNKQIADILANEPRALVVADSAEPKSIDEIKSYGINIVGARKGKDSKRAGIQLVQQQRISVTARSFNVWKAYQNYLWAMDKDGQFISPNEPDHDFSDTMDAVRYAIGAMLDFLPNSVRVIQNNRLDRAMHRQRMNSAA